MSSGASRAATAAASRDVKKKLVKILFRDSIEAGSRRQEQLNVSVHSYEDLRRAYLKKLHDIHPDKISAHFSDVNRQPENQQLKKIDNPLSPKEKLKKEFQELQSTWDRYEELSKSMTKVIQGDGVTANFTMFGVGCSFSDSEDEKALRKEITDQACRGWFSSGLISSGMSSEKDDKISSLSFKSSHRIIPKERSLLDDSMFVESCNEHDSGAPSRGLDAGVSCRYQRTLIQAKIRTS